MIDSTTLQKLIHLSWQSAGVAARKAWPEGTRMSALEVEAFLAQERFCAIATTGLNRVPHLVPGSLVNDRDATFWLPTVAGAVRLADLRSHPTAAVLVGQGVAATHALVMARGVVEKFAPDDVPGRVRAAARAKLGDTSWAALWLALRPERLIAYSRAAVE
ncbi:MAG: pyridoxamine 5'-phosphate oxidase family protein [Candidatus Dormibacteria bacterium]